MCARLTVLSETPIADAIAGCAKPSSRSNTIRRRWRCFSGMFFQCSAFLSRRTSPLLHLIIGPPESEGISQSHCSRQDSAPNYRKPPDSIRSGSGISMGAIAVAGTLLMYLCYQRQNRRNTLNELRWLNLAWERLDPDSRASACEVKVAAS